MQWKASQVQEESGAHTCASESIKVVACTIQDPKSCCWETAALGIAAGREQHMGRLLIELRRLLFHFPKTFDAIIMTADPCSDVPVCVLAEKSLKYIHNK